MTAFRPAPAATRAVRDRPGPLPPCPASVPGAAFAPTLASIPEARSYVLRHLGDCSVDQEVMLLLTSELVTNAICHAGTEFEVEVGRADGHVQVSVADSSTAVPRLVDAPPEAQSGRGLFFVQQYSSDWGVESTSGGKRVWFSLPCRSGST